MPDTMAVLAARYPRAFSSNGKPLWHQGGIIGSAREAQLSRTVGSALPLLLALWWIALSVRAYAADLRKRGSVIALAGAVGAVGWATVGPWAVVMGMAALDDHYGEGRALLGVLVTACLGAYVMTWTIADPRYKDNVFFRAPVLIGTDYRTTPTVAEPMRSRLFTLYRWTLAGTALGLLVVGVAYGYAFDSVRAGIPERVALVLAALGVVMGVTRGKQAGVPLTSRRGSEVAPYGNG
jgi:hypothetical protein